MRSKLWAMALVALAPITIIPAAQAAPTAQQTRQYHMSNGLASASAMGVNYGGVWFDPPGRRPVFIVAKDTTGTPVRIRAAQDTNNNFQYGDPGEPNVGGCGRVELSASAVPFDPNEDIAVFVSTGYAQCVAGGTTGTVTLWVD
ncbi:MAG: hypothetical protein ACLGH3_04635 [Actinomycetota bacterium]